ncbi:hypothetical protein L3Y34_014004 [Caenorhabditis briggsae]|uniref:SGNH domain-containing protein n=1 Tax=Caenorhabditis briggsae TaxID=6238 RepID=A0AAE9DRN7_CAEBR|nr:hypothetical protein L3Y34_014004 [Caenorhabditis briggsae]
MVHLFLGDFMWENNNRYSLASLCLVTNQLVIHDQADYFNEFAAVPSSINAYLHLWSLSLELQFYLFVPILFFGMQILKRNYLKLATVILITVFGFTTFALILDKFAFNFMFLRLWQFSAGFCALFWSKIRSKSLPEKEQSDKKIKFPLEAKEIATVSLCILAICLMPRELNVLVLRPLVTFFTAVIIACEAPNVQLFQSETLVYIGNISYVLYLVHWPIVIIFLDNLFKSYIFCILTILITSILLHHLFEKQYLKFEMSGIIPLTILLLGANAYLQYSVRNYDFWKLDLPAETREIIDKNIASSTLLWNADTWKDPCTEIVTETPFPRKNLGGYCRFRRGNGTLSIMLIGNSYSRNLVEPIRAHFHYNYSDFIYMSVYGNYVLYSGNSVDSQQALQFSKQQVELYKPDVLLVVTRYMEEIKNPVQNNDPLASQINENVAFYEKFVKKLYILDAHPLYHDNFLHIFLHHLITQHDNLEFLHLDKKLADQEMRPVKKRLAQITCNKCHFFDLSHVFVEDDKYLTFDKRTLLSYADNTVHLTSAGIELCEPVFEKTVREVMQNS